MVVAGRSDSCNTDAADCRLYYRLTTTNVNANVNDLVYHIENSIMAAASEAMPMKRGKYAKPPVPWFIREVAKARRQKIKAQRALRRN